MFHLCLRLVQFLSVDCLLNRNTSDGTFSDRYINIYSDEYRRSKNFNIGSVAFR